MPDHTPILLQRMTICDPGGPFDGKTCDIVLNDGKIQSIEAAGSVAADDYSQVISGGQLSPGWVDFRAYLTDPGFEWKEDLKSLTAAAAAGGFTSIVAHSLTHPPTDKADLVEALIHRSERLPVNVLVAGCVTAGHEGKEIAELYDMHQAGAIAFSDGLNALENSGLVLRTLKYLSSFHGLLMLQPMDEGLAAKGLVGEGIISTQLGLKGVPIIAEAIRLERDLRLLEFYDSNCRLHIGPITTQAGIEILRSAKKRFPHLTAETSAIYLFADDNAILTFDPNYKVWPPLRTESDREALRQAVLDGTIDVVSSGHHPQAREDKVNDFVTTEFGAAGIETAFAVAVESLGKSQLSSIVSAFTHQPRKVLGLAPLHIEVGSGSELTVFDWKADYQISQKQFKSKAENHPFADQSLPLKVMGIFAKGKFSAFA